jgi:hypothetical protein
MPQDQEKKVRVLTPGAKYQRQPASPRLYGGHAYDQGPERRGLRPILAQIWVFKLCYNFVDFSVVLGRFFPLIEDLELFLRPDLGEKLGGCFQLQAYIN